MRALLRSLPVCLALSLVACMRTRTEALDATRIGLLQEGTYAWVEEPVPGPDGGVKQTDAQLVDEARGRVEAALAGRGLRRVPERDAAVHMALRLDVSQEVREMDPFFAQDQVERFEKGYLTLSAFVPVTYEVIWRARSEVNLRTTAEGMGSLKIVWKEVDEPRDWQLEALAAGVVERLP